MVQLLSAMFNAMASGIVQQQGRKWRQLRGTEFYSDLFEEFKMTAVMATMEQAPSTRVTNNAALNRQQKAKRQLDELVKREGLEKASHAYIKCLIYHHMYHSD